MDAKQQATISQAIIDGAKEAGLDVHLEGVSSGEFGNNGGHYTALHFSGQAGTPDEYMVLKIKEG